MDDAFKAVKRNRGAAGIDKVSIDLYDKHACTNLELLMRDLKNRSYKPKPLKRVTSLKEREKRVHLAYPPYNVG